MTAEKDNKVYTIDEHMKTRYAADGYDIKDDEGNVIEYAKGKSVPYEEYQRVVQELNELKAVVAASPEDGFSNMTVEELKAYATEHEINIGNASSATGIAKKIREASRKNP